MGTASSVRSAKIGNDNQLRVEYLPLSSLKPAKRNPKRHQIDTVLASMERFGYVAPMVLNERTGRLVAGHGRLESLKKAKNQGNQPPERIWDVGVVMHQQRRTKRIDLGEPSRLEAQRMPRERHCLNARAHAAVNHSEL